MSEHDSDDEPDENEGEAEGLDDREHVHGDGDR